MAPLIQNGNKVSVIKMLQGTQYVEDDIIVFKRDGVYVIHRVEYSYE